MAVDIRLEPSSRIDCILGLGHPPAITELTAKAPMDTIGLVLLSVGVGSLQLALERSIGQTWPLPVETVAEAAVAVFALAAIAIRSARAQFTLFKFRVFRNLNFTSAVFYNFLVGALLFTTIVFLPALSQGPLGYDATQAGLALSPRGVGTMATMLAVGYLIDRIDHRALLGTGLIVTAGALVLMSRVPSDGAEVWLASASAVQGIGVGLLFTPLSTLAFSTLGAELRTDAAWVYSLLRQLGCATGVAVMTALLQAKIQNSSFLVYAGASVNTGSHSEALNFAIFAAYRGCFQIMAVITAVSLPGILLFRVPRPSPAPPTAG
jgi:MFS transporter, DHA2 family, multidrug resistance protein